MERLLVLYYSGVGNTKKVAEWMSEFFTSICDIDLYSVEKLPSIFNINSYNAIMIGFPTIHSEPAKPIKLFLNQLPRAEKPIPTFLFTTCGLYSTNALRIFAKKCTCKNLFPILSSSYRCAAVDGILLAPFMKCWFKDEKNIQERVKNDIQWFYRNYISAVRPVIPKLKWYSSLNYINKVIGNKYRFKIYLHKERCIKCGKCMINCPVHAINMDKDNLPMVEKSNCINCYRCIHHCPALALSLTKKPIDKTLNRNPY